MSLYKNVCLRKEKIAVIGLGYVGLPITLAFSKKVEVIGFDNSDTKIKMYLDGIDPTHEEREESIKQSSIIFTSDENKLKEAKFYIITVPTPIKMDETPDLTSIIESTEMVAKYLKVGDIVVYESTVYPGCTENVCIPLLEKNSGMKCGEDFGVGYSPERINPNDKKHQLENIIKIVSAINGSVLQEIDNVYKLIIKAGTYKVSNIKTAEAIKIAENSQRDINIAFMNELAMVFDRMGIDTNEVVDGMNTKWNALGFRPGLVGGHCIGVDPYYFTYQAERLGYHSELILNGRKLNNAVAEFVAEVAVRELKEAGQRLDKSKVVILGLSFKENCADVRCSKVSDIVKHLKKYGINTIIIDPVADCIEAKKQYDISLVDYCDATEADCIIIAVKHDEFAKKGLYEIAKLFKEKPQNKKILLDVGFLIKNSPFNRKINRAFFACIAHK